MCDFLQFDDQGVVHYQPGQEPRSTAEVVKRFTESRGDPVNDRCGRYELDGSNIRFTLRYQDYFIPSQTESFSCDGVVYQDHISLTMCWQVGPPERLEFAFVEWPPGNAAK